MPEFDGLTSFRKSGYQRMRDAEHLLSPPIINFNERGASTRHLRGAEYLCGYGVECLLKEYLISRHAPLQQLSQVLIELRVKDSKVRDICGAAGHDLNYLWQLAELESELNAGLVSQKKLLSKWSSNWRYNPEPSNERDAKARVKAARDLVEWINSRI